MAKNEIFFKVEKKTKLPKPPGGKIDPNPIPRAFPPKSPVFPGKGENGRIKKAKKPYPGS